MGGLYDEQMVNELHQGAQSLVTQWGLSEATDVKLLTVSENATFKAHDPIANKTVILRVHRPGYRTKSEIESELSWIKALRTEGIVETPEPLKTRSGDLVASFKTAHEERDVVAFSFMEGKEPSPDESLIDGFRQLGAISARLHLHAQSWERPVSFVRKTWNFNTTLGNSPLWGDWRAAMGLTEEGKALLEKTCEKVAEKLDVYGMGNERFGLVHADLRLANLLIDGNKLGVIDFDDCGLSWYMYDFAAAISFIEEDPIVPDLQHSWIEGYRDFAHLSAEDEAMFPTFIMLRRILLTAWLASHSETPTALELGASYTDGTLRIAETYLGSAS
nr:phosphotransferase [uncultured Cohaesibacter sp.]